MDVFLMSIGQWDTCNNSLNSQLCDQIRPILKWLMNELINDMMVDPDELMMQNEE